MSRLLNGCFLALAFLLCSSVNVSALASVPAPEPPPDAARVYLNPNTGRFWTMDSYEGNKQDSLTLHKYLYCHGNPVNGSDPTGLWREIPSNFAFGKAAEPAVIADFLRQRPTVLQAQILRRSIHGILGYASKTGFNGLGRLIPDLVDPNLNEIYDVKSWNETAEGMIKIQSYRYAFDQADPDGSRAVKWHAGVTYNYAGPNPVQLPIKSNGKDVVAMYFPTSGGVIPYKLYEVDNDEDRRRIPYPVPVPVEFRRRVEDYRYRFNPIGNLVYARYYARNAQVAVAVTMGAAVVTYVGIATMNSMMGAP